jgi:hypothetical protein
MKNILRLGITLLILGKLAVADDSPLSAQVYGFLRVNGVAASHALNSFGFENLSAPGMAWPNNEGNAGLERDSFQLSQSRIGVHLKSGPGLSGTLEVDFIDFSKPSPGTSALPRLRVANITYLLDEKNQFDLGQDWDVFSGGKPMTYNPVALYFGGGNAGFIRPQFRYKHLFDGGLSWESAVGLAGKNVGPGGDGNLELGMTPSLSTALTYQLEKGKTGVSAIFGNLRFSSPTDTIRRNFYGVDVFFEQRFSEMFEVHAAVYYGEALGSTGALTLALASVAESRHEVGGYANLRAHLGSNFKVTGGVGFANVLESDGSLTTNIADTRVKSNLRASVALGYEPIKNFEVFLEDTQFSTSFIRAADHSSYTAGANLVEFGGVYTF